MIGLVVWSQPLQRVAYHLKTSVAHKLASEFNFILLFGCVWQDAASRSWILLWRWQGFTTCGNAMQKRCQCNAINININVRAAINDSSPLRACLRFKFHRSSAFKQLRHGMYSSVRCPEIDTEISSWIRELLGTVSLLKWIRSEGMVPENSKIKQLKANNNNNH